MVEGIENNALAQMAAFTRKWFPGREITVRTMGEALYLEKDYWNKMQIAMQSGITKAFKG
ncbi:DUF6890 family protein [Desulfosediminicola sp.]|uniref:DUF6890 family protein n=1 Tax=Desulfosediminicola sp. TaxID=2886825 RepID=UPI003AF2C532